MVNSRNAGLKREAKSRNSQVQDNQVWSPMAMNVSQLVRGSEFPLVRKENRKE